MFLVVSWYGSGFFECFFRVLCAVVGIVLDFSAVFVDVRFCSGAVLSDVV